MAESRESHVMQIAAAITAVGLIASACTKNEPAPRPAIRTGHAMEIDAAAGRLYVAVSVAAEGHEMWALVTVDLPGRRPIGLVAVRGSRANNDIGMSVDTSRHVVYALEETHVLALDGRTGRLNTRTQLPGRPFQTIHVNQRTGSLVVEFQGEDGLAVIDAKTLARQGTIANDYGGTIANDYGLYGAAVDTERQRLYLISDSGSIAVCDLSSNAIVRTVSVRAAPFYSMAVDEQTGSVFVAGEDPLLHAIDPEGGTVLWSLVLEDFGSHEVAIGPPGSVFVVERHGALTVVDTKRRAIAGTLVIEQELVGVVVDSRTRTAYVLDARGVVHVVDGRTLKETGTVDVAAAVPEPVYDVERGEIIIPERSP